MIVINGKSYPTIADAAKEFRVAAKTVRDWIEKKIISPPPAMPYGIRRVQIFPPDYMKTAKRELDAYRTRKENSKKSGVLSRA